VAYRRARSLYLQWLRVIVVHGTHAFRDRVPGLAAGLGETSTTVLGAWYANVLRWRRPAALLVNELTLLPLVMPLAPAKTLLTRLRTRSSTLAYLADLRPYAGALAGAT